VERLRACYADAAGQALREPVAERPNAEYPYTLDLRRLPRS
jgi:hypothetical protein